MPRLNTPIVPAKLKLLSSFDDRFFQRVANLVPGMVGVYNINNGEYLYVNEAVKKILGFTPDEFMSKGVQFVASLVHPDDFSLIMEKNSQALKEANEQLHAKPSDDPIVNFEYRMRHKDGSWRWLKTDGSVFSRSAQGTVECVLNISTDITARKEVEEKLKALVEEKQEELSYYTTLAYSIADAIVSTDPTFRIKSWNKGAEALYGWKEKEVLGKLAPEIIPTRYLSVDREKVLQQIVTKGAWQGEVIQKRRDGTDIHILASVSHVKDKTGKLIGMVAVNRDITERRLVEEKLQKAYQELDEKVKERTVELTKANDALKEASKQREIFIGMASHELKTPLTSIKGFSQILERYFTKTKDTKALQFLNKVNNQIDKLASLVSDLLDLSKIEAGKLTLAKESFDVDTLVNEIITDVQFATKSHKIIKEGGVKQWIIGDRERIGQVLINFLTNAIKYSPDADKVIVSLTKNEKKTTITVKDYGIGISKKEQGKVFKQFYRGDDQGFPGLGIGLYIASEIIRRHGGKIGVESQPNKGSVFYFSLPCNVSTK